MEFWVRDDEVMSTISIETCTMVTTDMWGKITGTQANECMVIDKVYCRLLSKTVLQHNLFSY